MTEYPDVLVYVYGSDLKLKSPSSYVVQVLEDLGVKNFNVITTDDEPSESEIPFTDYPDLPQLFIKGEFFGGCIEVRHAHEDGRLARCLRKNGIKMSRKTRRKTW